MPTIGVTARLTRQKKLDTLLQATKYILESGRRVQLLVVGDGPLRRDLQDLAKKLEIEQHVIFTGFQSDIPNILGLFDVFAIPSLWEGHPLSIIEAMLAGKPVVASKIGGTIEVVLDNKTGILVPPGKPKVLAEAICTLLDSPAKRRKMGEKGRQRAIRHFSIDRMVRDYEEFYDSYSAGMAGNRISADVLK